MQQFTVSDRETSQSAWDSRLAKLTCHTLIHKLTFFGWYLTIFNNNSCITFNLQVKNKIRSGGRQHTVVHVSWTSVDIQPITSCAARSPPQYAPAPPWLWPFDLEVGVGVACDLGYPCAKFCLPRPFGFRVRDDVRDIRQTDRWTDGRTTDADDRLMPPPPLRGHNNIKG